MVEVLVWRWWWQYCYLRFIDVTDGGHRCVRTGYRSLGHIECCGNVIAYRVYAVSDRFRSFYYPKLSSLVLLPFSFSSSL